ncbi:MAG: hypothetical protein U9M94_03385 [Patescibacteria group bacterium]|nr:hypothetical protein [Patescibacteria group bacterium]
MNYEQNSTGNVGRNSREDYLVNLMGGEEKSFNKRVEDLSKNPENALKSYEMKDVVKDLMLVHKLSSNDLKRMNEEDNERLEKICGAYDPAVITMLVQYYEVNKKELKLN